METSMHQEPIVPADAKVHVPPKERPAANITDIIKFTPNLEDYILANIYNSCGKPDIVEHVRFSIYNGWNKGDIQRARICIFYGIPVEGAMYNKTQIVSYFLRISRDEIEIHLPKNNGNKSDMTIPYPTNG